MSLSQKNPLPQYRCHKVVGALKIKSIQDAHGLSGYYMLYPEEPGYEPIAVDRIFFVERKPHVGGYYVEYDNADGTIYPSFSPAQPFEDGYTLLVSQP